MSKRSLQRLLVVVIAIVGGMVLLLIWVRRPATWVVPDPSPYSFPALQTIDLSIGIKKMAKLEQRRAEALAVGILQEDDSSWVKAEMREGERTWQVKVRLKGDWTDHLEGEKWSFRVHVRDSGAWRGMRDFSLQSPDRRGHLDEWLFHKALAAEQVLSPRYDFIFLKLNGKDLGPYAVEEHFSKELLESQHHREGPILKWDESGMWDARVAALSDSSFPYLQIPFQAAANVLPFKQNRTIKDSTLRQEFRIAHQLMVQYRNGTAPPAELFDLELFAKQYALTDLFSAYHSLIWHNRRYYYNPVTSKLEPIVFDAFSGEANDSYIDGPIWGYRADGYHFSERYHDLTSDIFFRDEDFVRAYYRHLLHYTDPGFLDSLFARLQPDLQIREEFLRMEFGGYRLDRERLRENALKIRACLKDSASGDQVVARITQGPGNTQLWEVRNSNPLPIEVWIRGQEKETIQLLPAKVAADEDCWAVFRSVAGTTFEFRLPGSERN